MAKSTPRKSSAVRPETAARGRPRLSHITERGEACMVDVSAKPVTAREAVASARVTMQAKILDALLEGTLPKGDALSTARVAGILAAKRAGEWIPLCHTLSLDHVQIDFERIGRETLGITCAARTAARTGVEMEAMVGVSAAALCLYDMAKVADKGIVLGPIQLERKTGGKSGNYVRPPSRRPKSSTQYSD